MKFFVIGILPALFAGLAQANIKSIDADNACLSCPDLCTLLPPNNFPCYQGTPKNANFCFNTVRLCLYEYAWNLETWRFLPFIYCAYNANIYNTTQDPLLPDGETWVCGTCTDNGYTVYLQNDPIYTNMELWGKADATHEMPKRDTHTAAHLKTGRSGRSD